MKALTFLLLLLSAQATKNPSQPPAAYSIAGVVVDAVTGAPVPRAKLSIFEQNGETETTADANGRFRFQPVEPGKYPLYATALGHVREAYDQHGAFSTGIAVGPGLDSDRLLFRLHPQGVIYGRVSDEHGDAVRHAIVQLFARPHGKGPGSALLRTQTQTNDLGEYRFGYLPAGKYFLTVQARPWYAQNGLTKTIDNLGKADPLLDVVYPLTFYPGVTEAHSASELNVSAGGREEANIQLQAMPSRHVFFTNLPSEENKQADENNPNAVPNPVPPVSITANQKSLGSLFMGFSIVSGQVSPGEYEVAGIPPGEITFTISVAGGQPNGTRTFNATVVGGDTLDLAAAGRTANLSGRVLPKPTGADIAQLELTLVGDDNRSVATALRKDGTFSFAQVQAGTYKPYLSSPQGRHYIQQLSATGARVEGTEVTLDGTHDVQLTITLAPGVGHIRGIAQLDGKPKAGALVLLVPQSADVFDDNLRMDQSDGDGTFNLGNILPGKYWLMAIQDGWDLEWSNPVVLQPFHEAAELIQIAPDDAKKITANIQRITKNNSR
jgi:Carboxypeptidase regulatory-like domain